MRQLLASVAVTLIALSLVPGSSLARATYRITTDKEGFPVRLGPLRATSGPHARDAVAAFGAASSVRPGRGICVARWNALGLKLTYTSFGAIPDFCRDVLLQTAVVRSSRWATWAGLRVGMRSSRVPALHHNARFQRGKWVLATQDVFGIEAVAHGQRRQAAARSRTRSQRFALFAGPRGLVAQQRAGFSSARSAGTFTA